MATGNITSSPIVPQAASFNLVTHLDDYTGVLNTQHVTSSSIAGAITNNLPVDPLSFAETGNVAQSVRDLYYYRLWIISSIVNFGRILSPQIRDVEVWNSFFESRAFGPVVATGDENGQTLTGDTAAGIFAELESKMYTIEATRLGSTQINLTYDWQMVGTGDTASVLQVLGARFVAFLLRHNWLAPVIEQLAFKTSVLTGLSGKEQRIKLRQSPRRRIEMAYLTLTPEQRMYLEHAKMGQNLVFAVPLWSDAGSLQSATLVGATTFSVDTTDRDYQIGGLIFLQSADGETSEVLEIESFTSSSVVSTEPSINAFSMGARVCPASFGIMEKELSKTRHTSTVESVTIPWVMDTNTDSPNTLESYTPATYQGLEVYTEKNNYAEDQEIELKAVVDDADNDIGIIERVPGEDFPRMSYPFFKLMTRDEFPAYKQWFYNRSGKYTPMWWLDYIRSFKLVTGTALDSVFLTVKSLGYGELAFGSASRKHIAIKLPSGAWAYREVTAAEVNDNGTTTLTISSAPGEALVVDDDPIICLLRKVRLDSDVLDITWETNGVVRTATRFIDVF